MTPSYLRPFLRLLAVPLVLVSAGTLGYRLIEGWPLFDALYMTVTTMTRHILITMGHRHQLDRLESMARA